MLFRSSPYFFNAGKFSNGIAYLNLANFYSEAIIQNFTANEYDILFGPAYKGISLSTAASIGLAQKGYNIELCFNRKEAKDHGEGGTLIGSSLANKKAILIDDVITAGTTIRDSFDIAKKEGGKISGAVIALDRQEMGLTSKLSAIQEVYKEFQIKIISIISLDDIINYLKNNNKLSSHIPAMLKYKEQYGIN